MICSGITEVKMDKVDEILGNVLCNFIPEAHRKPVQVSASSMFSVYCSRLGGIPLCGMNEVDATHMWTLACFLLATCQYGCSPSGLETLLGMLRIDYHHIKVLANDILNSGHVLSGEAYYAAKLQLQALLVSLEAGDPSN
ncbi:hypothetical protein Ancab_038098 [Ancistrocladus abbreviatus]